MRLKGVDDAATKMLRYVFPVKCYILRCNLRSVSNHHAESEYVLLAVHLVQSLRSMSMHIPRV